MASYMRIKCFLYIKLIKWNRGAEKKQNMIVQDSCCKLVINVSILPFYPRKQIKTIGWWPSFVSVCGYSFSLMFILVIFHPPKIL